MKDNENETDELIPVGFRMPAEIVAKLNHVSQVTGLKKVSIVSMALEDYLDGPMAERIKRQVEQLSQTAKSEHQQTAKLISDALKRKKQYG